ncbi:MAG TPA: UDP-N-acetylglucosamine 2-epimerase (non-hydrolyzing) [Candidatus Aminicenantes bacterium]|nr:UDP-N-acetylglucosamine 2-epimerase (non-hydrolyzing) [Candidatus Aminicenantes bacterium]
MMILIVVGARPNFMKIAPIVDVIKNYNKTKDEGQPAIDYLLIHTGQHYDYEMSKSFFNDLRVPEPDIYLRVGSGTQAEQTGKIMIKFEKVCFREKPDLVIVVGDINSTIAGSLAAVKLNIPLAHIEAGLRSFDRTMPEEINRILTDQISDYLFTTCEDANMNLRREGIPENKIFFVGNVMIDTLLSQIEIAKNSNIMEKLGLKKNNNVKKYAVLTLHRPSNVDNLVVLKGIFDILNNISQIVPIIFPAHPRTIKQIKKFKLEEMISLDKANQNILAIPPLGYLDFLCLMSNAVLVLTDSGGIQEETTILGIPCLTLRNNTERPITVKEGTNILVGNNPDKIIKVIHSVLKNGIPIKKAPRHWDGKASERIFKVLKTLL